MDYIGPQPDCGEAPFFPDQLDPAAAFKDGATTPAGWTGARQGGETSTLETQAENGEKRAFAELKPARRLRARFVRGT